MLYAVNLVKFRIAFTWLSSLRLHASCDPSFHPIVRETKCVCVCVCVCVRSAVLFFLTCLNIGSCIYLTLSNQEYLL